MNEEGRSLEIGLRHDRTTNFKFSNADGVFGMYKRRRNCKFGKADGLFRYQMPESRSVF